MKFSAGYQLMADDEYINTLLNYRESINDIYFSWAKSPSGRKAMAGNGFLLDEMERQRDDLSRLSSAGIRLTLLLNANCYGEHALSRKFYQDIGDLIAGLLKYLNISAVTTTSITIGRFVRENFPLLDVRASVNMDIGTAGSMSYLEDIFTSFYIRRELNRDIESIIKIKEWCHRNGKGLHILGNGGCLAFCPARVFHDNLVAHEEEIASKDNAMIFDGLCRDYFRKNKTSVGFIRNLNWIRPEDTRLYEPFFDSMKLATRINSNPSRIVRAYMEGHYNGNLLELLEPDYSSLLYPLIINNKKFPAAFMKTLLRCGKQCENCDYCNNVAKEVFFDLEERNYEHLDQPNGQRRGF
jgi:collagenase-like PrtC family protease